jgi:hypothetical protein
MEETARVLASIGKSAIPALMKIRKSKNENIRKLSSFTLHAIANGRKDPMENVKGEFPCPKCSEVLFVQMPEKTVFGDKRTKYNFKWIIAKDKRKIKCSYCNANIYITIISEEEGLSNLGLQPSREEAKVTPISVDERIPRLVDDDEF